MEIQIGDPEKPKPPVVSLEEQKQRKEEDAIRANLLHFGMRIRVLASISRAGNGRRYEGDRWWIRTPLSEQLQKTTAIFLKHTTLSDGIADYDSDGCSSYIATCTYRAAWVCIKGREPERVFISDIRLP